MAGLCRPAAAYQLVKALRRRSASRSISTRTTPAASRPPPCSEAANAGRGRGGPGHRLDSPDQPAESEFPRRRAATPRRATRAWTWSAQEFADYWEHCGIFTRRSTPRRPPGARKFICTRCPGPVHEISRSRPPEWSRAPLARDRAHLRRGQPAFRRHREGDAQQQSRRHMTMFLITRGIKPADVLTLEPGSTPFPSR